jgi:hypothetical protein
MYVVLVRKKCWANIRQPSLVIKRYRTQLKSYSALFHSCNRPLVTYVDKLR